MTTGKYTADKPLAPHKSRFVGYQLDGKRRRGREGASMAISEYIG
jgi:hypothetical protein